MYSWFMSCTYHIEWNLLLSKRNLLLSKKFTHINQSTMSVRRWAFTNGEKRHIVDTVRIRRKDGEKLKHVAESLDLDPHQISMWSRSSKETASSRESSKKNFKKFTSLCTISKSLLQWLFESRSRGNVHQ